MVYQKGEINFETCKAKLSVPSGFRYLDAKQSKFVLSDLWGNPVDSTILGLLVPEDRGVLAQNSWAFTINFEDIGYVKDNDAESIDYDELLKNLQKETKEANPSRVNRGYQPINLVGWASKPYYDKEKKVLHWAKELKFGSDSVSILNYNLRILGKEGVFVLNAVATMNVLADVRPTIDKVLSSITFEKGSSYFDFDPKVDKVAAWTIGGLVAGKVLAKVGFFALFAKFFKIIAIAVVGAATAIWRFIRGKNAKPAEKKPLEIEESNQA
ncbi:MAG: DUF2167 domain-containing protein [Marinilabiliales bacterium]|nr:DUF2167 domain-containing protein [Marinilabiliales bacterium]